MNTAIAAVFLIVTVVAEAHKTATTTECASPAQEFSTLPSVGWKGTQKSFDEFRRLSPQSKSSLRSFELKDMEDLDVSVLLAELRPCTALESIRLIDVELLGEFPNTTEQKLDLPNLHEFQLKLTYPPVPTPSSFSSYNFYSKEEDTFEGDVNFKLEVGGYTNFVVNHNFGEFLVGYNESALASKSFRMRPLHLPSNSVV